MAYINCIYEIELNLRNSIEFMSSCKKYTYLYLDPLSFVAPKRKEEEKKHV